MSYYTMGGEIDGVPIEYTVTQEYEIVYSYSPEPDPNWTYKDKAGHEHWYDEGEKKYPTLYLKLIDTYWCYDCHDEHEDHAWVCKWCEEEIKPGTRPPSPFGERMPTYREAKITAYGDLGEEFTYQVGDDLMKFQRYGYMIDNGRITGYYVMVEIL